MINDKFYLTLENMKPVIISLILERTPLIIRSTFLFLPKF